jgi:Holliday junction resolvase
MSRIHAPHWKTAAVSEFALERSILQLLELRGIYAWPTHGARNRPLTTGISDINGVLPGGRFLAIEVKVGRKQATTEQLTYLCEVARFGGMAFIARSLEDVTLNIGARTKDKGL